ncbi:MAG: hypothetical protein AVDCRST_MAG87-1611, partial [uncultured Thermomicrobiales bacterium]
DRHGQALAVRRRRAGRHRVLTRCRAHCAGLLRRPHALRKRLQRIVAVRRDEGGRGHGPDL